MVAGLGTGSRLRGALGIFRKSLRTKDILRLDVPMHNAAFYGYQQVSDVNEYRNGIKATVDFKKASRSVCSPPASPAPNSRRVSPSQ